MTESSTYQALIERGKEQGLEQGVRATIFRMGVKRFGPLPDSVAAVLDNIHSVERLKTLAERLLEVETWDELAAGEADSGI